MGTTILTEFLFLKPGSTQFSLQLPEYLGANTYQLTFRSLADSTHLLASCPIKISPVPSSISPAVIKYVTVTDTEYKISFASPLKTDSNLCCFLFIDDVLYAVDIIKTIKDQTWLEGTFSKSFLAVASGRTTTLSFYAWPGLATNKISAKHTFKGSQTPLPKPINYGIFVDRYNHSHPWFMNHQYQYIFDGKIYFPVGGMWCPNTLISKTHDQSLIERNLKHDQATLDTLAEYGIDDVYLNLSTNAPLAVRQYFIDMLEQKGIHYGYQITAGGNNKIPSFFITRDKNNAGKKWQGLIHGEYSNGKITAAIPKSYKVIGFLVIPENLEPQQCFMFSFTDKEGQDKRHHIIDLETEQDYKNSRKITFNANLPVTNGSKLILIPKLLSKMHHSELWNPECRKNIKRRFTWLKKLKWGPGLRCFIDPIRNETNMVNTTENLRQYTSHINQDFAKWLEAKYKTVDELRNKWCMDIKDFKEASQLIPLRLKEQLWFCSPESGNIYKTDINRSIAWLDYNDMIRETYAAYSDEIAINIKSMVDIPVITKSVGVHGAKTHISRTYKGWDGTGYEVYLNQGFPAESGGGASRAEAEASSHTMWKVGTEVGYSAKVGNGGAKFFKTEKDFKLVTEELLKTGVSGFYYFGIDLKPGNLWKNHNYHDFPKGLSWIQKVDKTYKNKLPKASPSSFIFPGGYSWWWWTTRWKSVYDNEQNMIPQSVRINGDEWGSNTDVLPKEFERVIINCPYPPFSLKHADKINSLIKSGKNVIYLGNRQDLGAIAELDKYYSDDVISFADDSTAQVLQPLANSQILAQEGNKPWAIRTNNLLIISRTPIKENKNNADTGFKYLNPEWLK